MCECTVQGNYGRELTLKIISHRIIEEKAALFVCAVGVPPKEAVDKVSLPLSWLLIRLLILKDLLSFTKLASPS